VLDGLDIDRRAIAPAGEEAILCLAHVGDLDCQPDASDRQQHGERQRREIDHHAVAIVIPLIAALVPREALDRWRWLLRSLQRPAPTRRATCGAAPRPERHHPVVVIGGFGSVGCHAGVPWRRGERTGRAPWPRICATRRNFKRNCEIRCATAICSPGTPHFRLAMVAKKICSAPSKFLVDCGILEQYFTGNLRSGCREKMSSTRLVRQG
jgi:hypothetical protein